MKDIWRLLLFVDVHRSGFKVQRSTFDVEPATWDMHCIFWRLTTGDWRLATVYYAYQALIVSNL